MATSAEPSSGISKYQENGGVVIIAFETKATTLPISSAFFTLFHISGTKRIAPRKPQKTVNGSAIKNGIFFMFKF